jgi:N-acetyltransferase
MPFELQPTLAGSLVSLRPLGPDDFPALYGVASDPLIWEQHPDWNRYQEAVFRDFFRQALASGGALLALDAERGQVIGSSRYFGYDEEKSEVEIGWSFLARSHWGGRYNGEMKRLMLRHAFRFVRSVVFLIGPENRRSRQAVLKIGAVQVGSRPGAGGRTSLVYEITADVFRQQTALEQLYRAFNARDPETALAGMHPGVDWPDGMNGGRVHGRDAVRDYWTRQWALIDAVVEPVAFRLDPAGHAVVTVHQVIRNLEGKVLRDRRVEHVYQTENGLIHRMDIRPPSALTD